MEQYLITAHYERQYMLGLATKKDITNRNYKIKLFQWILSNPIDTVLPLRIIAFKIKNVDFLDIEKYDREWASQPGDIILFQQQGFGQEDLKKAIKKLQTGRLPSYVASKRAADSISKQKRLPGDMEKIIKSYLKFGSTIRKQAKKHNIRLTIKKNGKRIYKSEFLLKQEIKKNLI
jgi:hypothetical protein